MAFFRIGLPLIRPLMIHVALASNSNYFYGLATTVVSLLYANRSQIFSIHIIDGGLTDSQRRFLTEKIRSASDANVLRFYAFDRMAFSGFKPDYGNSLMSYARILLGSLLDVPKVIYLDTDLLIIGKIAPLWDLDLEDHIAAAAPDSGIYYLRDDYPLDDDPGDARYFNSGVMVISLVAWRTFDAERKILDLLRNDPSRFKWWDQTAMNAIFKNRVLLLDPRWNCFAGAFDLTLETHVIHYVGSDKPWSRYLDNPAYALWRSFFGAFICPHYRLFLNKRLFFSTLSHFRYRAVSKSDTLRTLALWAIKFRAFATGKKDSGQIERFNQRYNNAAVSGCSDATDAEIKKFTARQWSFSQ